MDPRPYIVWPPIFIDDFSYYGSHHFEVITSEGEDPYSAGSGSGSDGSGGSDGVIIGDTSDPYTSEDAYLDDGIINIPNPDVPDTEPYLANDSDTEPYLDNDPYTADDEVADNSPEDDDEDAYLDAIDESVLPLAIDQGIFVAKNCLKPFVLASAPAGNPTNTLTYTLISGPSHGTLYLQNPSNFNLYTAYSGTLNINMFYLPSTDYTGTDTISYMATEGSVDSEIATITFNVQVSSAYTYPIGIPTVPFGIAETVESVYGSSSYYTHYIDPTHPSATNSGNPNGSPSVPRISIPTNPAAGSVVVIAAGTFSGLMQITAQGTSSQPIFYKGLNQTSKPMFTGKLAVDSGASYIIFENIALDRGYGSSGVNVTDGNHICIRHSDFADAQGGILAYDTISDIVFYNNYIHDCGDLGATEDIDDNGMQVGGGNNIWILDSVVARTVGSGIVINPGFGEPNSSIHNVYIARNVVHGVRQSGLYTKQSQNCVFSQNLAFSIVGTSWAQSTAFGFQYGPESPWFIFNRGFNCEYGIGTGSNSVDNPGANQYIIGNVFHRIRPWDNSGASSSPYESAGIALAGGVTRHVYNNTIYDAVAGINCPDSGGEVTYYLRNNIISIIRSATANHIYVQDEAGGTVWHVDNNLFYQPDGTIKIKFRNTTYTVAQIQALFPSNTSGNATGDPLFVKQVNGDFNLRAGSPAINGGTSLASILSTYSTTFGVSINVDFNNDPRIGTIDIGAFEKQ